MPFGAYSEMPRTYTPEQRETNRVKALKWYYANKDRHRAKTLAWRKANRERVRANDAAYRVVCREKRADAYNAPEVCEVCSRPPNGLWKKLHYDHCHASGKFRGWLCSNCNTSLGLAAENPDTLRALAAYLEKHAHMKAK